MNGRKKRERGTGSRRRMLVNGITSAAKPDWALPLGLRLRAIAENVPTSLIDELWVFPPLPNRDLACEFLVLVCYDGGEDRRRILTAHVDARRPDPESEECEWVQRLREHGTAPHSWVADMPDRLLRRLSEAGVPEVIEVGGYSEAWEEAVARLTKGNGNGNGSGGGHRPAVDRSSQVDSRVVPGITFTTINETSVSPNGTNQESG